MQPTLPQTALQRPPLPPSPLHRVRKEFVRTTLQRVSYTRYVTDNEKETQHLNKLTTFFRKFASRELFNKVSVSYTVINNTTSMDTFCDVSILPAYTDKDILIFV